MTSKISGRSAIDLSANYTQSLACNLRHCPRCTALSVAAVIDSDPRDSEDDAWVETGSHETGPSYQGNFVSGCHKNYEADGGGDHAYEEDRSFAINSVGEEADE